MTSTKAAQVNPANYNKGEDNQYAIKDFREVLGMSQTDYELYIERHHYALMWTFVANGILGLWLIANPFLFDYKSHALVVSDTVSGALIILFEMLAFSPRLAQMRWCTAAVGFWLLLAPLIFWSPTPAVFLIDTLVACLVMAFAMLIPGIPGRGPASLEGPDQPPYWTYNPSSWIRRWLGIALALVGFFISRYLAAHQLGYIPHAWDPFFGAGSDHVTGSALSRSFPISDAGFGAVAYMMETLTGFMGDRARWRTAPFIAVMFALLVIPLGATSIVLVVLQPVVVGAWCGLCLISAAALLTSVPLAVHEAVAVGQFLVEARAQKKNLWRIFWFGGSITGAGQADPDRFRYSFAQRFIASIQGVTVPWPLLAQLALGLWLMARPDVLPAAARSADLDHLLGAIVVTVAAISTAEVTRAFRFVNMFIGLALIIVAFVFAVPQPMVFCSECLDGILLLVVSLPRGEIIERYGNWDRFVK
jgi:hypothetical protein